MMNRKAEAHSEQAQLVPVRIILSSLPWCTGTTGRKVVGL